MSRVALTSGAYEAKNIIPSAQACVNLYMEKNPEGSQQPVPTTHYLTPGLTLLASAPIVDIVRCAYRTTGGYLYTVVGTNVYYVDSNFTFNFLGTIPYARTPVYMSDNGIALVIVSGGLQGWTINISNSVGSPSIYPTSTPVNAFSTINDPNFVGLCQTSNGYGATRVDIVDGFFIFNAAGTNAFFKSLVSVSYAQLTSNTPGSAFNALDYASKSGQSDPLQSIIAVHDEVVLPGTLTTEIWYNTGASDFTFGKIQGVFLGHGMVAQYSLSKEGEESAFWLANDREGRAIFNQYTPYSVKRISTHALETIWQTYTNTNDALSFCYQVNGHAFVDLVFPSADATWTYDIVTQQWHQKAWADSNGILHRHRANCAANCYGVNIVGDWQNGNLYSLNPYNYTDNGNPIVRIRTFPHLMDDEKNVRVTYNQFIADVQCGTDTNSPDTPQILLSWSDDRGVTYSNPIWQSMGQQGQYRTNVSWRRLGMARDRVFKLQWSAPVQTSLNGAFVDITKHAT